MMSASTFDITYRCDVEHLAESSLSKPVRSELAYALRLRTQCTVDSEYCVEDGMKYEV